MRQLFLALLFSVSIHAVCVQPLQAQTTSGIPNHDKQYYLFASLNAVEGPRGKAFGSAVGGGVERFLSQRATIGLEVAESLIRNKFKGLASPKPEKDAGSVLWFAINGGFHFRQRDSAERTKPFLTAGCGISGINGAGVGNQINYGAGFNHWRTRHLGIRIEIRRFFHYGDSEGRFTGLRVGLVIR
ncbi:MAG: hypothetical protein AB7U82_11970 [Blastocatellales bacterium]